jgi:hypothetical protein
MQALRGNEYRHVRKFQNAPPLLHFHGQFFLNFTAVNQQAVLHPVQLSRQGIPTYHPGKPFSGRLGDQNSGHSVGSRPL